MPQACRAQSLFLLDCFSDFLDFLFNILAMKWLDGLLPEWLLAHPAAEPVLCLLYEVLASWNLRGGDGGNPENVVKCKLGLIMQYYEL